MEAQSDAHSALPVRHCPQLENCHVQTHPRPQDARCPAVSVLLTSIVIVEGVIVPLVQLNLVLIET